MCGNLRELIRRRFSTIMKYFKDSDPYQTGYVSQRQFREALSLINVPVEAATFAIPGVWHEEREVHEVEGADGYRPGPFKEHLIWLQDPLGAQPIPDVTHGHVKYREWLNHILSPADDEAKEKAIASVTASASELYELWRLVCAKKHDLLTDFWSFDKEKLGYVGTSDFHRALQICLGINKEQASLLLSAIPFEGKSGSIAYRRWIAEFCRSPKIGWQSYLNMNLLATGSRELDIQHAEKATNIRAKMEATCDQQDRLHKQMLEQSHIQWQTLHSEEAMVGPPATRR